MSKTITIVGAGPGLGTEIAKRFAERKYTVCGIARDSHVLDDFEAEIQSHADVRVFTKTADVTNTRRLRTVLNACSNNTGVPNVVVCNTSMFTEATPTQINPKIFEQTWRVIALSALTVFQQVVPDMRKRGSGTILMPGTSVAVNPWPPAASLGAAKAAARNLMLNAHQELKPDGINAAVITIYGMIKEGTAFDPKKISKRFLEVAELPKSEWKAEFEYPG